MKIKNKFCFSRSDYVIDKLHEEQISNVLDIGFLGTGYPEFHCKIMSEIKVDKIYGIDSNSKLLSELSLDLKFKNWVSTTGADYTDRSIYSSGFCDYMFDAVLMLEIIEHLENPFGALREVRRILKKNGKLVLTYPNPNSLLKLLSFLLSDDVCQKQFIKKYQGAEDHKFLIPPACAVKILNDCGFEVTDVTFIKFSGKLKKFEKLLKSSKITRKLSDYIGITAVAK